MKYNTIPLHCRPVTDLISKRGRKQSNGEKIREIYGFDFAFKKAKEEKKKRQLTEKEK